jgi:hypothetical protein
MYSISCFSVVVARDWKLVSIVKFIRFNLSTQEYFKLNKIRMLWNVHADASYFHNMPMWQYIFFCKL